MRSFLVAVGLICMSALPALARDKDDPKPVEMKGVLHTGVVAIGGETTGVVVETKEGTYELDLGKDKDLKEKADKLDGKPVVVAGKLTIRKGVEVKERKIIAVESLKAGEEKKPDEKKDVTTGIQGAVTVTYLPGVPTDKAPEAVPAKGMTVHVLAADKDTIVLEAKTNDEGKYRLALPAGDYRVQIVQDPQAIKVPALKVTVKEGEVAEVKTVGLTIALR